ncbi:hypothetical protein FRB96_004022 [Tulasnella sp. 330]|nr:hypothetical protein FRB96_004022 [Tulasnella sp. 330]KAG8885999.1 hypothetical protein FRB97_008537 [Tulasnella sp. 331]KAG8888286.1 hypothetical protein FRB98_008032 [Tulasnella sp. 332]
MSTSNQPLSVIPYGFNNDKLGKSYSHNSLQPMYIPPYTPPRGKTNNYSPTNNSPTFIIQHMPPSPVADVNVNKPWFLHTSFVVLFALFLTSIAVTLHQFAPLINSSASAVHNVGQVFGATAHVGHALGDSVGLTTRVGKGVTGAVGDLWCLAVGGSSCPNFKSKTTANAESTGNKNDSNISADGEKQRGRQEIPPRIRGVLSGDMALATMYELGVMPSDLNAPTRLREVTAYLRTSPYLKTFSSKWWLIMRNLAPGYEKMWQEREMSVRTTFNTFRKIVDQFEAAEQILALPPTPFYLKPLSFLSSLLHPSQHRDRLSITHAKLHRTLINLVTSTHSHTRITQSQLNSLRSIAQSVLDESKEVLEESRVRLMELKKELVWRKESRTCGMLNPLSGGVVGVMGGLIWSDVGGGMRRGEDWCDLREVEFAIEWCGRLVWMVEVRELEAIQTMRLAERLGDQITTYVNMFNATASVEEVAHEIKFHEEDAWVIMTRVTPGMVALRHNVARDLIVYQDNMPQFIGGPSTSAA